MGWQDREWAKWTDEERARYLGSPARSAGEPRRRTAVTGSRRRNDVTLLAMLVSLVVSVALWHTHLFPRSARQPARPPALPAVVYGTGLSHFAGSSDEMTCTAMAKNAEGAEYCTSWTVLSPGQQAVQAAALPPGTPCAAVVADQQAGRWVCTSGTAG